MKKVFQTILAGVNEPKGKRGNCMQAVVASLLELSLDDVPNFIDSDLWWDDYVNFMKQEGYEYINVYYNPNAYKNDEIREESLINNIKNHEGVNGYFKAVVASPKYWESEQGTHAVIIDKDLNIVHDPSPNYQDVIDYPEADEIGYHGIRQIWVFDKIDKDLKDQSEKV
jgi:hypothetical protein